MHDEICFLYALHKIYPATHKTGDDTHMLTVGDKLPELRLPVQQGVDALPAGETIDLAETNGKY